MPDISMCKNIECSKNYKCYRYTAVPSRFLQSYADFTEVNGECEFFWDNELHKK